MKHSPFELTDDEVLSVAETSSPGDWLFSEEEGSFSYRPDLLIQLVPRGARRYCLMYGARVVAGVLEAHSSNALVADVKVMDFQLHRDLVDVMHHGHNRRAARLSF